MPSKALLKIASQFSLPFQAARLPQIACLTGQSRSLRQPLSRTFFWAEDPKPAAFVPKTSIPITEQPRLRIADSPNAKYRGDFYAAGLALLFGAGLVLALSFSSDRKVFAKSVSATAREMCMLTRLNDVDSLNRLFSSSNKPDPNAKHLNGWAPIHVAAANNNLRLVLWWLDHGADINLLDDYSGPAGTSSGGGIHSFEAVFDMIRARQQVGFGTELT